MASKQKKRSERGENCFEYFFEHLNDAAIKFELVNGEPHIIEANNEFKSVFGYAESDGNSTQHLNELIVPSTEIEEANQFDTNTGIGKENAAIVDRMTMDGKRTFLYRGIPYDDNYGFAIYSDISDEIQQQQHLDVLHRVLRHNLRNELTVILGMASQICMNGETQEVKQNAEKIKRAANTLSQLSDETKTIEKVLNDTSPPEKIHIKPFTENIIKDCRGKYEQATFTNTISENEIIEGSEKLGVAIKSIIDNAIRHNPSHEAKVHVSKTTEQTKYGDQAVVKIADNGPGIDATEQNIITGDEDITPLNHGSGLGLWVVKWVIEECNGEVDIETPNLWGGTTVRLRLNVI